MFEFVLYFLCLYSQYWKLIDMLIHLLLSLVSMTFLCYLTLGTFSALHKELTNLNAEQILQSEEYLNLKHEAERKNLEYAIHHASYDVLKYIFFHTLIKDKNKSKINFSIKYIENFDFQKVLYQEKKNFIKELKKITDDNNIPQHKHDPDDDGVMTTLYSSHVNYIDNDRHQINNDYRNQMYELVQ